MIEETIIEKRPTADAQSERNDKGHSWKNVTLGGVSGILMGAGLMYARHTFASSDDTSENATTATAQEEETPLYVAQMHNDLPFAEAFEAARAEVGPGGVFIWHGGIYNTYSADEWDAMTPEQKNDFALKVNPEVSAHEVPTPTDAHPTVAVHTGTETNVQVVDNTEPEPKPIVDQHVAQSYQELENDDVHIVGYAKVEGHLVVGYDFNDDEVADVAIIDMGPAGLSRDDVVVTSEGEMATIEDLVEVEPEPDPFQMTGLENPEVAPGMPDYTNDADINDMIAPA